LVVIAGHTLYGRVAVRNLILKMGEFHNKILLNMPKYNVLGYTIFQIFNNLKTDISEAHNCLWRTWTLQRIHCQLLRLTRLFFARRYCRRSY